MLAGDLGKTSGCLEIAPIASCAVFTASVP
jgi:hypothetical protein